MPAGLSTFRFPHNVQAVLQQIRQGLGIQQEQTQLGDAVALLDDRDRWVEDNLSAIDSKVSNLSGIPPGALLDWAGPTAPDGFLMCDGAAVSRTTYADLFGAIGTVWGIGNGSSTFNVPDLRGARRIGSGTGAGLTLRSVGQKGGEENHLLTTAEMPSHTHTYNDAYGLIVASATPGSSAGSTGNSSQLLTSNATGGGGSHNNMQPWACVLKIIKT